jgi:hypothetical protein
MIAVQLEAVTQDQPDGSAESVAAIGLQAEWNRNLLEKEGVLTATVYRYRKSGNTALGQGGLRRNTPLKSGVYSTV